MLKTITKLLFLGSVLFSVHSSAQYDPYFTHYMLNKLAYNPAVAGEKDAICVNALTHQQWSGQSDQSTLYHSQINAESKRVNPRTNTMSITAPLLKDNKLGVGVQFIQDQLGYNSNMYLRGSVAWKINMGRKLPNGSTDQRFAIGADFGMLQVGLDGSKFNPLQPGDPQIPTTMVSGAKFDMGFGVYYTHQRLFDGFYAGISMTHLTAPTVVVANAINFETRRYMYLLAGTRHDFGTLALMPSLLVKAMGGPLQVDIGARAMLNNKLVVGLNVRTGDALSLLLGYHILPNLYVGYSYDITALSGVNTYTKAGTHELFASYCFDLPDNTPPPLKPRYNVRYLEGYSIY